MTGVTDDERDGGAMSGFEELFGPHRVLAILRGFPADRAVAVASAAWDIGFEVLEVTIGEPAAVPALAAVVAAGAERGKLVGAGTVTSPEQVRAAALAGARYTVAPGLDLEVLAASLAAGLPHLPGVATGTEVQHAYRAGCRWVKAFPATALGPAWFRAIRGPFPDVNFVGTGGITVDDAPVLLDAGARAVGLTSGLDAGLSDPVARDRLAKLVGLTV
jgi:2-dehydro-3-deoxyphosphogluconate aldolase / (4S)-4-hydroxy-2-oxoglutarate aldolase